MPECFILSAQQVAAARKGGAILRACLDHVAGLVEPGKTTADLDREAEAFIRARGGEPAFKGYHGFSGTLCTSVNDEVVHGIPGERVLQAGDIVAVDCGVRYEGIYTDACVTVGVGPIDPNVQAFLDAVSETLESVIRDIIRGGVQVGTVSAYIQSSLEKAGFSPIRELTGHALGTSLHLFPDIPNTGKHGTGPILPAGTMIAVEPIASMGGTAITQDDDMWTIRTKDGSLSCHFEHTILLTEGGCEVIA